MNHKPSSTRREFLKTTSAVGGMGAALAVCGPVQAMTGALSGMHPPLHTITAEQMTKYVGSRFRIVGEEAVDAELLEVVAMPSGAPRPGGLPRNEAFTAVFRTPEGVQLEQQTYRVQHAELGRLDLFLGSVPQASGEYALEAVFN